MKTLFKYNGLTILWALFIFIICNVDLGGVGKSNLFFDGFDKVTHCGLFFVLVTFIGAGYLRKNNLNTLTLLSAFGITLLAIIYGGVIELLQRYIFTWRSGEWPDFFCDAIGACMAMFCILVTTVSVKNVKA
jgi:VanZ family protein